VDWYEILGIAIGLALDAAAVSLSAGATGRSRGRRAAFRLSFHFGLFQFLMPLVGWLVGSRVAGRIGAFDHWIAFVLLALVGAKMIQEGLSVGPRRQTHDPSRGLSLIALSVATSIDALAVGLGLGVLGVPLWIPCLIIGLVTALLSLLALRLGHLLGRRFGSGLEIAGGLLLVGLGVKILIEHLRM
jgi:putative Mn2+ efflux pump MntP